MSVAERVSSADRHNRVLDAATERSLETEARLAAILVTIFNQAGSEAARNFRKFATDHLTASIGSRPVESLLGASGGVEPTATMVALKPRAEEAARLALPGEDPSTLHVTLLFLGLTTGSLDEIRQALVPVVGRHGPMVGVIGGVGAFDDNGKGAPSILLPSVPGLVEVRVDVAEELAAAGVDYSRTHGYIPHMTLEYDEAGAPPSRDLIGEEIHFDSLWIVRGDVETIEMPFTGTLPITAAAGPPLWSPPAGDEVIDVAALAKKLRTKTDPVRLATIESTMKATLDGANIAFDATNPFTAKVLAQSGSQVTHIAQTTQLNVMRSIKAAYNEGLSIPDTATLIQAGMQEASLARATLIARTELAGAVNGGSLAATNIVQAATGVGYDKKWLTAPGAQYPRHENYDGLDGQQTVLDGFFTVGDAQLQFPGDPAGPPEEVCNCVIGDTRVEMPGLRAVTRRWHDGDVVKVRLASGDVLAATPNHPVLRADGVWVPVGDVKEGDDLVSAVPRRDPMGAPNVEGPPPTISELYHLANRAGVTERVVVSPGDFHGDGSHGEVEVVRPHGLLLVDDEAATDEEIAKLGLAFADMARAGLRAGGRSPLPKFSGSVVGDVPSPGRVRVGGEGTALAVVESRHPETVSLARGADGKVEFAESSGDGWTANVQRSGYREDGFPVVVSVEKVVMVKRYAFHGYVYNLDTGAGWFTAGIIASRNCRCTLIYEENGQQVGEEISADEEGGGGLVEGEGGGGAEGEGPVVGTSQQSVAQAAQVIEAGRPVEAAAPEVPLDQVGLFDNESQGVVPEGVPKLDGVNSTQDQRDAAAIWRADNTIVNDTLNGKRVSPYAREEAGEISGLDVSEKSLTDAVKTIGDSFEPISQPVNVYRVLGGFDDVKVGDVISERGFAATSTNPSIPDIARGRNPLFLTAELPAGSEAVWLGDTPSELLLRPETKWKIVEVTRNADGDLVARAEIDTPMKRIGPPEPVTPPEPVVPPPPPEPNFKAPITRPFAHIQDSTLNTQIARTKKALNEMLDGPTMDGDAYAKYQTLRQKLQDLIDEKGFRDDLPGRPYEHYADNTLKTQIYRTRKLIEDLEGKGDLISPVDRGKLEAQYDKMRGLLKEQDIRGFTPAKPAVRRKVTAAPSAPQVKALQPWEKPPANERIARLRQVFAERESLLDPLRNSGSASGPFVTMAQTQAAEEISMRIESFGQDIADEVKARALAKGWSYDSMMVTQRRELITEVMGEIRPMGFSSDNTGFVSMGRTAKDQYAKLADEAAKFYPRDWVEKASDRGITFSREDRGYFQRYGGRGGSHKIVVGGGHRSWVGSDAPDFSTMVHEMAHLMEATFPQITRMEYGFYTRRTVTDELKDLPWSSPRKAKREFYREDKFVNPYMGRDYSPPYNARGPAADIPGENDAYPSLSQPYELLSTGMEGVFTGAYDIWSGDRGMTNFILGMLVSV